MRTMFVPSCPHRTRLRRWKKRANTLPTGNDHLYRAWRAPRHAGALPPLGGVPRRQHPEVAVRLVSQTYNLQSSHLDDTERS